MALVIRDLASFLWKKLVPALKNTTTKRLLIGTGFFISVTAILSMNFLPERIDINVGQPFAQKNPIFANRTIEFEDKIKTSEAKRRAAEAVGKVHEEDPGALDETIADINNIMNKVKAVSGNQEMTPENKVAQLKTDIPFILPEGVYSSLAKYESPTVQGLDIKTREIVTAAYNKGIPEENISQIKSSILEQDVAAVNLPEDAKTFMGALIDYTLRPNFIYNAEETQRKKEAAMEAVAPVRVVVQNNEKIVGQGDIVTAEHIQKLEALGLLKAPVPVSAVLGIAMMVAIAMAVVMVYLYQNHSNIYLNEGFLLLIALIVICELLLAKTVMAIQISSGWADMLGYMIPVAAASMLLAILLDTRLALLATAVLSGMVGVITGSELRFALVGMISGLVAVYSVSRLSQRSDMAKAGLVYVSSANILAIISVELVTRGVDSTSLAIGVLFGLLNGIFSAVLTIGVLPYLESAFGITSSVKLLELANPGQPLLKQLLMEAPGTYHHSILVGNLAEAAADAVGGDSLLVRVGSYYHDIGKLRRPYFFIENQLSSENPHDKLTPNLSTLIITSHTKDGAEIAGEYKLPRMVIDIIEQHHGTSLVSFFFHRALENDKNEKTVNEEDFRYEGPKPQNKEAALVMMADSVEAAVRALQKPTPGRIEGLVRRVIKEKLLDGQLDECDLTFKDLDIIAGAFVRVLSGIFHTRVEYPETVIKEIERRKARDASIRKQSSGKSAGDQQAT
ncbi:HD family phosphohydrolase [Phosphitispora fastidiosa]|uniref:HD family phosphohydrolase n=1 Tax=Phosphitispora fastidiosa TaxID=2837202 RepID=UPI001E582820|nr:HDIG domain-containing metalloprotein [Phosphitispora fastidiosa]MBU7005887.1 putative nucleotidyltransferase with HDIG domain [Phosphitispora fastidiosa]